MNSLGCLLAFTLVFFSSASAKAEMSCQCPVLTCDPCSVERGVTFYSDKCGPTDSKVRSCARPTCVPIETATKECPNPPAAAMGSVREPVVATAAKNFEEVDALEPAASVGRVRVLRGSVSLLDSEGKKTLITADSAAGASVSELKEGGTIDAGADGAAILEMEGGNKVHVHPDTKLTVKEFKSPQSDKDRRALLQLIKGKIRNQVHQKYDGKTSYFKVVTRTAVAGVRGTDFVIEHKEGQKLETRLETLEGKVIVAGPSEVHAKAVYQGHGLLVTSEATGNEAILSHSLSFSPIYEIPSERLRELDLESRVDIARKSQDPSEPICRAPRADFDQCAWRCLGNPSGEKKCRTDLSGVTCVRSRCDANGVWSDETRLPSTSGANCLGSGFRVGPCDY